MKVTLFIFLLAIASVVPIGVVGARFFDGVLTDNTYNKSVKYDDTKHAVASSDFVWTEPVCSADGKCAVAVAVSPMPDENSVVIRIFRPSNSAELASDIYYDNNSWHAAFKHDGSGWYVSKVEYTLDGLFMNGEKSFYIR